MRLYILCALFLISGAAYAQDDADATLQKAQDTLKQAQAAVDAAVKAKQVSDKAKGSNTQQSSTPAVDNSTPAAHKKYLPIDVGLDIYTDGTVGASYSYNGRGLNGFQDFADVIHSLNDDRCNNLLNASSTEDTLGWVGMAAGTGLITYYVIDVMNKAFSSAYSANSFGPDISGDTPFLIGGNVAFVAGTIMFLASNGDFSHAINRYNHQVAKQNKLSFYFDPNPNKPELGLVQRF